MEWSAQLGVEASPAPPTESSGVSAAVEPISLPPLTLNVSGEGGLAPRKDTKKKDHAPKTKECAHCLAPDGQHGVTSNRGLACLGSGVAPPLGVVKEELAVLIVLVRRHHRAVCAAVRRSDLAPDRPTPPAGHRFYPNRVKFCVE